MRYNEAERAAVLAVNTAFTNELHWVFREQSIVDVGIDAFIEKSDDGNPAGKFIAVQIKSRGEDLKVKKDRVTIYVTNVHHGYWLSLNVPILLVAYIPIDDTCYWISIDKKTLKKTKTQWKVNIPKINVLDSNAKANIEKYLVGSTLDGTFSQVYENEKYNCNTELSYEFKHLEQSQECIANINRIINEIGAHFSSSHQRNMEMHSRGFGRESAEVRGSLKQQSRKIEAYSLRLLTEIHLFSESFSGEYYMLEKYLYSLVSDLGRVPEPLFSPIMAMPSHIKGALSGVQHFNQSISTVKNKHPEFKKALSSLHSTTEVLCSEYGVALEMISTICNSIENK